MRSRKAQSAIEYLTTYGWALLVIAIALGVLFQLGIFSSNAGTTVQPGSCRILRPYGPNTTAYISRQGACGSGIPKYVAVFKGNGGGVNIGDRVGLRLTSQGSVSLWISPAAYPSGTNSAILFNKGNWVGGVSDYSIYFSGSGSLIYFLVAPGAGSLGVVSVSQADAPLNTWTNLVLTWGSGSVIAYVNGAAVGSSTIAGNPNTIAYNAVLGTVNGQSYNGLMGDVQVYNTSLTSGDVAALYKEGLGGVPINLQNIVGWWPLNGDANDYSGDNLNGAANSITFLDSYPTSGAKP